MTHKRKYYKTKASWPIDEQELKERFQEYNAHVKWVSIFFFILFIILLYGITFFIISYHETLVVQKKLNPFLILICYFSFLFLFALIPSVILPVYFSRYDLKCPACQKTFININSELLVHTHICPKCGTQIVSDTNEIDEK